MTNFAPQDRVCLMMGDTDAIKAFVFETSILPEIRGGSEILSSLEDEIPELIKKSFPHDAQLIYCGGGGFLAIVRDGKAEELKQRIEQLYYEKTTTATITVVYTQAIAYGELDSGLPLPVHGNLEQIQGNGIAKDLLASHFDAFNAPVGQRRQRKNFGEWIAQLVSQMQRAKRQKSITPFVETLPIHRRCDSCGKRPSAVYERTRDEEICTVCWAKRRQGRNKWRYVSKFECWLKKRGRGDLKFQVPESLSDISKTGRIAVIYADGNNMGDLLQRVDKLELFKKVSETLETATHDALFSALADALDVPDNGQLKAPFEIIALGGDDAIVVVPSNMGWDVARKLVSYFEEHPQIKELQQALPRSPKRLTMSAGVAIADEKYPVGFLMGLAQGLLKKAKQRARQTYSGTICHLWLRAPIISESAELLLTSLYYKRLGNYECRLTARPYTWQEADDLSRLADQLRAVPKSQRRALAEALERGLHVSLNYALYQAARHTDYKLQPIFAESRKLVESRHLNTTMSNCFWVEVPDEEGKTRHWETALLDALELVDLYS